MATRWKWLRRAAIAGTGLLGGAACYSHLEHPKQPLLGSLIQSCYWYLVEQILHPESAIPYRLAHLTAPKIEQMLRNGGLGVQVAAVEVIRIGVGQGFLSMIARVKVTYVKGGLQGPPSVIVKLAPAELENRIASRILKGNAVETMTYRSKIMEEANIAVPECFWVDYDPVTDRSVIVQKDMAISPPSQLVGSSFTRAKIALRGIARLHANTFNSTDRHKWVPKMGEGAFDAIEGLLKKSWPKYQQYLTEEGMSHLLPCAEATKELFSTLEQTIALHQGQRVEDGGQGTAARNFCVVHGDFRLENCFFVEDKEAEDGERLVIIDFQGCKENGPEFDVAYFIGQSCSMEIRRAHEKELLRIYYDALGEHFGARLLQLPRDSCSSLVTIAAPSC
jgi:hypothetical protein